MSEFVKPHRVVCKKVEAGADCARVAIDSARMKTLINKYPECVALAHPQIDDHSPLSFYVTRDGEVMINPHIVEHGRQLVDSPEGCMTFQGREGVTKQRYRIITVEYQRAVSGMLTVPQRKELRGFAAIVAQHEIDHLEGKYCYD